MVYVEGWIMEFRPRLHLYIWRKFLVDADAGGKHIWLTEEPIPQVDLVALRCNNATTQCSAYGVGGFVILPRMPCPDILDRLAFGMADGAD